MGQLAEQNLAAWQDFQRGLLGGGRTQSQKDRAGAGPKKRK
jgi:hypothetical protein